MKILKNYYILFIIISFFMLSCGKKCRDCPTGFCDSFIMDIRFLDKNLGVDVTGDNIFLPIVRYDKDSIKYQIESSADTTLMLNPIATLAGPSYTYNITYNINGATGIYNVILFLNATERDTIVVDVVNNKQFNYYYKDSLLPNNGNCGFFNYVIKK